MRRLNRSIVSIILLLAIVTVGFNNRDKLLSIAEDINAKYAGKVTIENIVNAFQNIPQNISPEQISGKLEENPEIKDIYEEIKEKVNENIQNIPEDFSNVIQDISQLQETVLPSENEENTDTPETSPEPEIDPVYISFIDVGQGDSILIIDHGQTMLVDTGYYTAYDNIQTILKEHNVFRIDVLVLTHPDADHIQNAPEIIEDYGVNTVLMPQVNTDTKTYRMVKDSISANGVSLVHPIAGSELEFGSKHSRYQFIGPITADDEEMNSNSLVLRITDGADSVLLTGDATDSETDEILASGFDVSADLLKVAHHGSANDCNSKSFLNAVDPEYAVISCGLYNDYGHPHREVMKYLKSNDIKLYRTDTQGTVECKMTGDGIKFTQAPTTVYTNGEDM